MGVTPGTLLISVGLDYNVYIDKLVYMFPCKYITTLLCTHTYVQAATNFTNTGKLAWLQL